MATLQELTKGTRVRVTLDQGDDTVAGKSGTVLTNQDGHIWPVRVEMDEEDLNRSPLSYGVILNPDELEIIDSDDKGKLKVKLLEEELEYVASEFHHLSTTAKRYLDRARQAECESEFWHEAWSDLRAQQQELKKALSALAE